MNRTLRKLHIYFQGWWRALTAWRDIRLAEDLDSCAGCKKPIRALGRYLPDEDDRVWHYACAKRRLGESLEWLMGLERDASAARPVAKSRSEYKRLKIQGADPVLPDNLKPGTPEGES